MIEALEDRLLLALDFGDAPAPYPTTLAENGARHTDAGPRLGASRDAEADGTHSAAADADDTTGTPDDEDGVSFGTIRVGQLGATVTVNVQNAPSGAKLDAWIDFNADGSWSGPLEQIADRVAVVNGNNTLLFDVPTWALDGPTFARFRLSTPGNLSPKGLAADGEVEDYQIIIQPPVATFGAFGVQNVISNSSFGARSVFAADMDADGDTDVLSASVVGDRIEWFKNDGTQNFTANTIAFRAIRGPSSVFATDLDGDGDIDALSSALDRTIEWYKNDGSQNFTTQTITTTAGAAESVFAADVDGDGDIDVLSAYSGGVAWYENDGNQNFTPQKISILNFGWSVFAADVDRDGDMDVLSADQSNDKIAWYENDRTSPTGFTAHMISSTADGPRSLFAADLDGDGDTDVLSASVFDNRITWYENDGTPAVGIWKSRDISTTALAASSVFAADVDGDGDMDVLSASPGDNTIAWYENNGASPPFFIARTISTAEREPVSVFPADVDGDGDLDVLSASITGDTVAWYENISDDFGDAPAPYPTLLANNGARHHPIGPMLGTSRDVETDGQPNLAGTGDDTGGIPDDEDGVTFGSAIRVGQLGAGVTVNVQNAPGGAKLDAWIDWNGDGSWGGPLEQIADRVAVVNGDNPITFDVPSTAQDGPTYARFRISTAGNLGTKGLAADGEVEDYQITIQPPVVASGVFGGQKVITTSADGAFSVFAADVDGDGDIDVLSASGNDDKIAWYENDGSQNFTARTISTAADGASTVFAADLDGDGDTDVLSASLRDDKIAWYENDGNQNFTARTISIAADNVVSVFAVDMDGDGDIDVLSASVLDDKIAWYQNDGSQNFTARTISAAADGAVSVFAADVDRDGDMDVISASVGDDKIAWYQNDGSQNFTARTISTAADFARSVFAADVDGDGDTDILSASRFDDKIAWYENHGNQTFMERRISTAADSAGWVFAADVDGDGDTDVLSPSYYDDKIAWYENDGTPGNGGWTERTISTAADGAFAVFAADVDGDGDIDVRSASFLDDKIAWYENLDITDLSVNKTVDNSTRNLGQTVTFTVTLTNSGPGRVTGVQVRDSVPAGLNNVGVTPSSGTSYNSGTGVWSVPTLVATAGSNTATLTIAATVAVSNTTITNTAEVTAMSSHSIDPDSTPGNNNPTEDDQASVTITVPPAADLSLSKSVDRASPNLGETVTFTVTLTNSGPDAATGVRVTDVLPAGLSLVSATPGNGTSFDSSTGVWSVPSLPATAGSNTARLTITATVTASNSTITNTAEVTGSGQFDPDSTPGNHNPAEDDQASASITVPPAADLVVTKTESVDPVVAGFGPGNLTYVVTVTNNGPDTATGVVLSEDLTLPAGVTGLPPAPSQGSFTGRTWTVGTLSKGSSATLTVVLTADHTAAVASDAICDTATLTAANEFLINRGDDTVTVCTSVTRQVDLVVTKTESADPVVGGSGSGNLTYVVTVQNAGPSDATGVALSELLTVPSGVSVDSITPSGATSFAGTTWTVGDLSSGSSATLTVVLTVGLSAPTGRNVISNTVAVTAVNETLINTGDDSVTRGTSVLSGGSCLLTGDPSSGEQRELGCAGTPLSDNITITLKGNFIEVNYIRGVRFRTSFAGEGVGRIIVYGLAGNDFIHVGSSDRNRVTVPTFLFGGPGKDHLHVDGGDSTDVLVGGDGDDHLETGTNRARPGQGRDVLIAGRGHDRIKASAGDNILIAGFTDFDADMSALAAIAAEWTRTGQDADPQKDYQTRVDHLLGLTSGGLNGLIRLNRTTVHDDGDFDVLDGFVPGASQKNQRDWFLANVDGDSDRKKKDRTGGVLAGEVVTDIYL